MTAKTIKFNCVVKGMTIAMLGNNAINDIEQAAKYTIIDDLTWMLKNYKYSCLANRNGKLIELQMDSDTLVICLDCTENKKVKAKFIREIKVVDPNTNLFVKLALYKEESGAILGVDSSYVEQEVGDVISPHGNGTLELIGD